MHEFFTLMHKHHGANQSNQTILMSHFCVLAWRHKWKTLRGSDLKVIKLCRNYTDYFLGVICAGCLGGGVIYRRVVPHSYLSLFMQEQTSSAQENINILWIWRPHFKDVLNWGYSHYQSWRYTNANIGPQKLKYLNTTYRDGDFLVHLISFLEPPYSWCYKSSHCLCSENTR